MYLGAIFVALLINSVIIILAGGNIFSCYGTMFRVSLGSPAALAQTLNKCTPLLLGGVAVAVGNRGRVFNIGSDGQIYMGAIFATGAGLFLTQFNLPKYRLLPYFAPGRVYWRWYLVWYSRIPEVAHRGQRVIHDNYAFVHRWFCDRLPGQWAMAGAQCSRFYFSSNCRIGFLAKTELYRWGACGLHHCDSSCSDCVFYD